MLHQALCVTDDSPAVAAALASISPALVTALLGEGATAEIEIAPFPDGLCGTTGISLAVDDLEARVAACRAAGLEVTVCVGGGGLTYAVVTVAGLDFELVEFAP